MPKKSEFSPVVIGMGVIIVLLVVAIGFLVFQNQSPTAPVVPVNPNQPALSSKAKLQVITVAPANCEKCVLLTEFVANLKSSDLDLDVSDKIVTLGIDAQAQELVTKYSIGKLPALVLLPDANALEQLSGPWEGFGTIEPDNALILREVPLPYWDVSAQKIRGLVSLLTIEAADCPECAIQLTSELLRQTGVSGINQGQGVFVDSESTVSSDSADGQRLITQYVITKLPAVLLSADIADYPDFFSVLEQQKLGSLESDGTWVLRNPFPLYFDLTQSKVRGVVEVTNLTDANCVSCFDVNELSNSLVLYFGLKPSANVMLDVLSVAGKALVQKYSIVNVPTVLVKGDVSAYQGLSENWNQRGFIASDGTLVFSRHDLLPSTLNYFDLNSNTVKVGESEPQVAG